MPPNTPLSPPNEYANNPPPVPVQGTPPPQPYDFIVNPGEAPKQSRLPGGNSKIIRVMFVLGGLLLLLIAFNVVKGLISGGGNTASLTVVVQDQQELLHLTKGTATVQSINESNSASATTINLAIGTSQSRMISYMAKNGKKIKAKEILLGIDTQSDQQLAASIPSDTYNETYQKVMQEKLNKYMIDLKKAYAITTGKNGKAMLKDDYSQAQLLYKQLSS